MRLSPAAASVLTLALALGASGQSGEPQDATKPVFPGQVDLVRLDIVALDAAGRPVTDLKEDEVWILENGRKQEIVSFVPIRHETTSAYRETANDVAGNAHDDGRLIFLVLDDANSMRTRTPFVKEAAIRLVQGLRPEDWVGMMWVSKDRRGSLEFTKDHALVLGAIRAFAGEQTKVERWFGVDELAPGPSHLFPPALAGGVTDEPGSGFSMPRPEGQQTGALWGASLKGMFDAQRPFLMAKGISDQLRSIEARRRAIVYIGQGTIRKYFTLMASNGTGSPPKDGLLPDAIAAARDANVTFHTIDISDPATRNAKGPTATEGPRVGEFSLLSDSTGGVTSRYSNPAEAADRVVASTSVYYLAGYSPPPPKPKEGKRHIEVRSTRPGVRLLARNSYVPSAKAPPTSPRLEAARTVRDLMPVSDLNLRAFAAPFADKGKKQQVAVVVEVSLPETAMPRGAAFAEDLEMTLVVAAPGKGVRAAEQVSAKVTLNSEGARSFNGRYLVCGRISVEPGQYQLRLGVRSSAAGRAGSVYLDVGVPDFAARAVSLSGLVIGQTASREPMPVARGSALVPILPFTPSLARDFTAEDEAWAFARVYRGKGAVEGPVVVTATITRLDTDETAWTSSEKTTAGLGPGHAGEYRVALPLSTLAPGSYRLRIDAAQGGDSSKASRELDFRVTGE